MRYKIKTFTVKLVLSDSEPQSTALGTKVGQPADAVAIARAIYANLDADREHLTVLLLDTKHVVTGFKTLFSGTINQAEIHVREVCKAALLMSAAALILVHNHPSGNPAPSAEDRAITARIKVACELLEIRLLDHLILGSDKNFSFADAREL